MDGRKVGNDLVRVVGHVNIRAGRTRIRLVSVHETRVFGGRGRSGAIPRPLRSTRIEMRLVSPRAVPTVSGCVPIDASRVRSNPSRGQAVTARADARLIPLAERDWRKNCDALRVTRASNRATREGNAPARHRRSYPPSRPKRHHRKVRLNGGENAVLRHGGCANEAGRGLAGVSCCFGKSIPPTRGEEKNRAESSGTCNSTARMFLKKEEPDVVTFVVCQLHTRAFVRASTSHSPFVPSRRCLLTHRYRLRRPKQYIIIT